MRLPSEVDHELPWGYWLRLERQATGQERFVDLDGESWPSLREAFWRGRLEMPVGTEGVPDDVLELMLAVLVSKSRGLTSPGETLHDIHGGNHMQARFFDLWLKGAGLLDPDAAAISPVGGVSPEGRSAMLMLGATRPQGVRAHRPSSITVGILAGLGLGTASVVERANEVEAAAAAWPAAFLRWTVGWKSVVVLVKRDVDAPVPVTRTVWTQTFQSVADRDAFYDWLCRKVDRWQDWAELAWSDSAPKLTSHLLALAVLSGSERDGVGTTATIARTT